MDIGMEMPWDGLSVCTIDPSAMGKDQRSPLFLSSQGAGFSCVLDLSNPIAVEWFHGKLRALQEKYDIDGFKFDAGDPYMYRGGDRSAQMQLPLDCTADYARFVSEYPFNELRAVWNMGGRPLVCRLQDKVHTWGKDKGLGARYLVIPMLEKGRKTRTVILPKGQWKESHGTQYTGGLPVELDFPLEKVYVFERMA